jgi:hypothetical protein
MPDDGDIEQRLRTLEDLAAIRDLVQSYGYHLDRGNWSEYAELFAADGQLRLGPVRADGREEIERVAREQLGAMFNPGSDALHLVHLIGEPRIQLDREQATAETMWTVVRRGEDGASVVSGQGRHLDDYVREEGRWRIRRRRGFQDIP